MVIPNKGTLLTIVLALVFSVVLAAAAIAVKPREIPLAELRAKYASPSSRFVTLKDGALIHVRVEGPPSAPVIVMVPGLHSPLHIWEGWITRLRDEFRVIAVDLPGQGLSDSWPRHDYSIAAMDSFITEVTVALGIQRFTFAGHSMSGAMGWRYALAHPDRIDALILVSAGGFVTDGAGPILPFRLLAAPVVGPIARRFITRPIVGKVLRQAYGNPELVSEAMVTLNYELINGQSHAASLGGRLRYLMSYEPVDRIKGVRVPTLIIWGDKDRLRPVIYASMFLERIQGSELRVLAGVGHFPMEEAPEASSAHVRAFMRGIGRRPN